MEVVALDEPRAALKLAYNDRGHLSASELLRFHGTRAAWAGTTLAECTIFSGTDAGASWGPDLSLVWKNRAFRINLRAEGRFGVDDGAGEWFGGVVAPNTWHRVRIGSNRVRCWPQTSRDGKLWYPIQALPRNQFQGDPIAVRLGKMSPASLSQNFSIAGPVGACAIKDLRIYGPK